jgi:hypothetical protein
MDTLKYVVLVCWNPGHGDGGSSPSPERNASSALVYARKSDHDREMSRRSFILGEKSRVRDVVVGCCCGGYNVCCLTNKM